MTKEKSDTTSSIFLLTDYATTIYLAITGLAILFFYNKTENPISHLTVRIVLISILVFLALIDKKREGTLFFIRLFIPVVMLSYIYGDTAALNRIFFSEPLDNFFIKADKFIFGYEPALLFSQKFDMKWFGEIMNAGYFSYYFMLLAVTLSYFFLQRSKAEKSIFIILTSFYIYYLIFIIFPVVGPQFHYNPPQSTPLHTGFFSNLVEWVQRNWEHPTGAFPSSHVGMAIIYLIMTYKDFKKLFFILLPFTIIILFATVYIKAHYAVDVLGGIASAPVIYFITKNISQKLIFLDIEYQQQKQIQKYF